MAWLLTLLAACWAYLGFRQRQQARPYYEDRPPLNDIDRIYLEHELGPGR